MVLNILTPDSLRISSVCFPFTTMRPQLQTPWVARDFLLLLAWRRWWGQLPSLHQRFRCTTVACPSKDWYRISSCIKRRDGSHNRPCLAVCQRIHTPCQGRQTARLMPLESLVGHVSLVSCVWKVTAWFQAFRSLTPQEMQIKEIELGF